MTEGTLIVPDDEAFGGAFEIEDDEVIPEGASDPMPTYKWRIK